MPNIMQTISLSFSTSIRFAAIAFYGILFCGIFFFLQPSEASAQNSIYPTVLYSGVNPFTVSAQDGIDKIEIYTNGSWKPMIIGTKTADYKVMTTPIFKQCAKQATFSIFVERIDRNYEIEIRVTDCDGSRHKYSVGLENTWTLFYEDFGTVTLNDQPCHTFSVQSNNGDFIVDKVVSSSNQFKISYPFKQPPLRIRNGQTYRYSVCFTPRRVGQIKVPINVHVRRRQPVGEYTTYIVADTAYVNVIEPPYSRTPPTITPPVVEPPPRPRPPRLPPNGPTPPPKPPPQVLSVDPIPPEPLEVPELVEITESEEHSALGIEPSREEIVFDPTTFRMILTPTARSLGKDKGFVASYDVAGIVAGYGLTDRLTVIGGGIFIPVSTNQTFAFSAGGKYEFYHSEELQVAAGLQANYSTTKESEIFLAAPYATLNYGNIDRSINVTAGYSWRRHTPSDSSIAPFTRQALLAGVGGDLRFAHHWKVAGEAFLIDKSEFQPFALTLRYFDNRFAIDGGIAIDMTPNEGFTILPVLSGIWTW